ncbi:putative toxin-antitoxin system, toxin component [Brevibacterium mcbrellneri ATCC 49030]|uniref:Putative toxin-antitoxin system, toxin component n=1 Tax=Brevibacterium mcbrellneri ATCC 49030 TaxID=585530 RepID=D4YPD6_9MICO|nr:putative toxin-antitoxin system, toxin component [Brevibacterium mcbrellneri ATCC 49030]
MNTEQTVSAAVPGLQLGDTFTFDELLRSVQDQRHRRLRVIELANLDTHDDLCALWRATETDDLVLHARTDSTLHRQQFILHELAHMILAHCDGDDCAAGIRGSVFAESASGLTPKAGDRASRRGIHYATPADAGLHTRDITITTPAGPCPAWRIDGDPSTWAIHIHGLGSTRVGTPAASSPQPNSATPPSSSATATPRKGHEPAPTAQPSAIRTWPTLTKPSDTLSDAVLARPCSSVGRRVPHSSSTHPSSTGPHDQQT